MTYLERTDAFIRSLNLDSYRVGGSVRDEITGHRVKDADYMIRASLSEIQNAVLSSSAWRLPENEAEIGPLKLRSGVHAGLRVSIKGLGLIEITLPRTERSTGPGHGDFEIICDPTLSLDEDAIRRDFTINALYKRVSDGEVLDPLGRGIRDLNEYLIEPCSETSFRDDPLRILRGLRLRSERSYSFSEDAYRSMTESANAVTGLTDKGVSGTVWDELQRILMGDGVDRAFRDARDTGVLAALIPELAPTIGFDQESRYHDLTVDEHTFEALFAAASLGFPLRVRLALLFHDSGKPATAWRDDEGYMHYYAQKGVDGSRNHETVGAEIADAALRRLNVPRKIRSDVDALIRNHMVNIHGKIKASRVRLMRVELGDELLIDLLRHVTCDTLSKGSGVPYQSLVNLETIERIRAEAQASGVPASIRDLKDQGLIEGSDLIDLGIEGEAIGTILKQLLHEVASQPKLADRDWLLGRAKTLSRKVVPAL